MYNQTGLDFISGFEILLGSYSISKGDANLIFIDNCGEKQLLEVPSLVLSYASETHIRLKRMEDIKLEEPYNKCINSFDVKNAEIGSLIQRTESMNSIYNKDKCYFLCFLRSMSMEYNCSFPDIYELANHTSCTIRLNKTHTNYKQALFNYEHNCSTECPTSCESSYCKVTQYQVLDIVRFVEYIDYGPQDNDGLGKYFPNTLRLFIYYESLAVMQQTQYPKTKVEDLFSKIGGTLGLFIGFRLLSFVDILEFILKFFYAGTRKVAPK